MGRRTGQPGGEESGRLALFVVAAAVIVASAVLFSGGHGRPAVGRGGSPAAIPYAFSPTPSSAVLMARLRQQRLAVEAPARRFLATFFRYEVGQDGPEVRRSMAATSTHGFYESLQRRPPAPVAGGGFPARAVLERLRISFVSRTLGRALVRGTARRNGLPEEFAFIFIRRAYGWVAAAAGE